MAKELDIVIEAPTEETQRALDALERKLNRRASPARCVHCIMERPRIGRQRLYHSLKRTTKGGHVWEHFICDFGHWWASGFDKTAMKMERKAP